MQDIEFEVEQNGVGTRRDFQNQRQPWMVKFLMGFGITDASTANFVLLGVAAIFFGITIFLSAGVLGDSASLHEKQRQEQIRLFSGMPTS